MIILATVAIKSNTYVRKELEDSQEGKMEDFDVDKDWNKWVEEGTKNQWINKYLDREAL